MLYFYLNLQKIIFRCDALNNSKIFEYDLLYNYSKLELNWNIYI